MFCPSLWPPGPVRELPVRDRDDRVRGPAFDLPGLIPGVLSEASCVRVPAEHGSAAEKGLSPWAPAAGWIIRQDDPCRWMRALKRCRAISTGQLRGLPRFHLRPIDVVVYHGSRRDLVLRRVSRLDAFSGYPVRT